MNLKRFTEASTWAGFAGVLQGIKGVMPEHAAALDGLTILTGIIAGVVAEKGNVVVVDKAPAK